MKQAGYRRPGENGRLGCIDERRTFRRSASDRGNKTRRWQFRRMVTWPGRRRDRPRTHRLVTPTQRDTGGRRRGNVTTASVPPCARRRCRTAATTLAMSAHWTFSLPDAGGARVLAGYMVTPPRSVNQRARPCWAFEYAGYASMQRAGLHKPSYRSAFRFARCPLGNERRRDRSHQPSRNLHRSSYERQAS